MKSNDNYSEEQAIRNKFTFISFVCSILVIFIHTNNLDVYGIHENSVGIGKVTYVVEMYWREVLRIAVPMFFFISGVLFFRTFEIKNLFSKWKSRITSVLIPYLIWCSLYYLYNVVCTNIPAIRSLMGSAEVVKLSVGSWVNWLWVDKYYTLWFLQNLIIFILLTPLIWILLKNHWKKFPTGLFFLVVLLFIIKYGRIDRSYFDGLNIYIVGSYIGLNCRDILKYKNKKISLIAILFILFTMLTAFRFWNFLVEVLLFFSIWYAIDLLNLGKKKLYWWMSITFFVYVAHDVFLEAFEKIVWIVFGNQPIFALLDYIFMPFIVYAFLILIAYVLRRWLPVIWKILTGNRKME